MGIDEGAPRVWKSGQFLLNPVVTLIGLSTLIGFSLYCILDDNLDAAGEPIAGGFSAKQNLKAAQSYVTVAFTWAYIGSQDLWALFLIAVYMKFGNVKLGKDEDEPEFANSVYFMMIFCCGVAVGLFFYGVSEPLYHLHSHRYANDLHTDNEKAQYAINLTLYHWGIHGWVVYSLVAITMGFVSFKKGLNLTIRSCFYPMLGNRIYGWFGDFMDGLTIFTVVAGVCTSLGLGAIQISDGLIRLGQINPLCPEDVTKDCNSQDDMDVIRVTVIWAITIVATASVLSGLNRGIKGLSQLAFLMAMVLWSFVFFAGNTHYFLNLMVQSFGYYFQNVIQLGFVTDAWSQLTAPQGGGPDGKSGATAWLDWWTIFYWGWWIAWSPFVGMFLAKISKGRTIKEVFHYTLSAPFLFSLMWFCVFGGEGISQKNRATYIQSNAQATKTVKGTYGSVDVTTITRKGIEFATADSDSAIGYKFGNYKATMGTSGFNGKCFKVPKIECAVQQKAFAARNAASKAAFAKTTAYNATAEKTTAGAGYYLYKGHIAAPGAYSKCDREGMMGYAFGNPKISPLCNHYPSGSEPWFQVLESFEGWGNFLSWFSIFNLVFYFCTSSDSGSLVVDAIASNGEGFAKGDGDSSSIQRVIWAATEGLVASALIMGGGADALGGLQAASICAGLPYTAVLTMMMISLWRGLNEHATDPDADWTTKGSALPGGAWKMDMVGGVFEIFEQVCSAGKASQKPEGAHFVSLALAIVCPFVALNKCFVASNVDSVDGKTKAFTFFGNKDWYNLVFPGSATLCYYGWAVAYLFGSDHDAAFGWALWLFFAYMCASTRAMARNTAGIEGNGFEDFCVCVCPILSWQAVSQLEQGAAGDAAPAATEMAEKPTEP